MYISHAACLVLGCVVAILRHATIQPHTTAVIVDSFIIIASVVAMFVYHQQYHSCACATTPSPPTKSFPTKSP